METILIIRQADKILPKLGSSHNYLTRNRNQLAAPKINLQFAKKKPLAAEIQDDDLWSAFEDCGMIDNVRVIRDEKTGIGKGFGYVNFKTADAVELALNLNEMPILNRNIRVNRVLSDPKNNRNLKTRKVIKHKYQSNNESLKNVAKHKEDAIKSKSKLLSKSKSKPEFQGQKTKPNFHKKKIKKNKKFDKKKMAIKQLADGMK